MQAQEKLNGINEPDLSNFQTFLKDNEFNWELLGDFLEIKTNNNGFITSLRVWGVKKVTDELAKLSMLQSLHLNLYGAKKIPDSFANLKSLHTLKLDDNLKDFPVGIANIPNLESLFFYNTTIKEIPPIHVPKLKLLDIRKARINNIESIVNAFPELTHLILYENPIFEIPSHIQGLIKLKELSVGWSKLKTLADELFKCTSLETLELQSNAIAQLSPAIKNLTNLKRLDLGSNKLKELPEEIVECHELEHVSVRNNQIKVLPTNFYQLAKLKKLNVAKNKLTAIDQRLLRISDLDYSNNPCSNKANASVFPTPEEISGIIKSEPYRALLLCEPALAVNLSDSTYGNLALKALAYIISDYEEHGSANKDMNGNKPLSYFSKYKVKIEKALSTN